MVSVGTSGHIRRRVIQRIVSSSGSDPFPVNGIFGKDFVSIGNNNTVIGGVGSNGQVSLGNDSDIDGGVTLWDGAPNPTGYTGDVTRIPQPFVFSPPNMLNPETLLDSNTSNYNGRLLAGANPFDSCSGGGGPGTRATRTRPPRRARSRWATRAASRSAAASTTSARSTSTRAPP